MSICIAVLHTTNTGRPISNEIMYAESLMSFKTSLSCEWQLRLAALCSSKLNIAIAQDSARLQHSTMVDSFELAINSLNHVPMISGTFYVKWRYFVDGKAQVKGRTTKYSIYYAFACSSSLQNFGVIWDEKFSLSKPPINNSAYIEFSVEQVF